MAAYPKTLKLILWGLLLFIAVLGCDFELPVFVVGQKTPTGTHPAAYLLTPDNRITPKVTPTPTLVPSGAACLPGVWQIDYGSVVEYMHDTIIGVGETGYMPLSSGGKLELQIEDREVTLVAEDFRINVGVDVAWDTGTTFNEITIQANGTANYLASDAQINFIDVTYNVEGTLKSDSGIYDMGLEDLINIANIYGFARDLTLPVETVFFSYNCFGDVLTIEVNPYGEVVFKR